jgi:hypothetical protein
MMVNSVTQIGLTESAVANGVETAQTDMEEDNQQFEVALFCLLWV